MFADNEPDIKRKDSSFLLHDRNGDLNADFNSILDGIDLDMNAPYNQVCDVREKTLN